MRKTTLLLVALLAILINPNLQAQRTCAAHDHMLEQLNENPKMHEKQHELEEFTQKFVRNFSGLKTGETRTIPVHVIVIYANSQQNISQAQIQSQIDVLNADYGGTNSDLNNVPSEFAAVTSQGTGIQFVLEGIERHSNSRKEWGTSDAMKTAYPPTTPETMLNMWICNIGGGILGYAQFPGGASSTDGVVFSPQYCGSSDYDDGSFYLSAPFDKGRTCTHEIGHYLNLRHIWGDGNCSADDYVDDTPIAGAANYNCPSYPSKSCSNNGGWTSDMFMNYMDYVDDQCMFMFSEGQKARMWACLNSSRSNLGYAGGNANPTAEANGPYTGDANVSVSFSSNGSNDSDGSIVTYNWNFGDGASSTAANPSHTYSADGIYIVSLTVTDNEGATNVATTTATIGNVCSGTQACDGNISMTLVTDKYGSETSWTLKNSIGQTIESGSGYGNNTTYNFNWTLAKDTYTFAITDSYGDGICCSYGNGSYTITDGCTTTLKTGGAYGSGESFDFCVPESGTPSNENPIAEANGPYTATHGSAISFSSNGSTDSDGTIFSYTWTFGDGETSTEANPSYTYAVSGNYTATLTVTDNEGATNTDQAVVTINELTIDQPMVSSISINRTRRGKNYTGIANIYVAANNQPLANAKVEITWSGEVSGTNYGYTDNSGTVKFQSDKVQNGTNFTITINNISKTDYYWNTASSQITASTNSARKAIIDDHQINIYPNPAYNELYIEKGNENNTILKIYTTTGQLVKTTTLTTYKTTLNVSDLQSGLYLIQINNGDEVHSTKLLKK